MQIATKREKAHGGGKARGEEKDGGRQLAAGKREGLTGKRAGGSARQGESAREAGESSPREPCDEARGASMLLVIYSVDTCWHLVDHREEGSLPPRCSPRCLGG